MPERTQSATDDRGEGFDAKIERLREVVVKLEAGSLSLEQSLAVFEQGVRLSREGAEILDAAERRVEILTRSEDGHERTIPFQTPGDE
ncbi:MAG: exodeoxyribonuclease VII small subunit [Myxococcales bacterium]|nr:exodeoxyribonuclease VII small subunit [Myxococcales bacterium]